MPVAPSSRSLFDCQVVDKQTLRGRRKMTQQGVERWDVSEKPRVRKAITDNGPLLHQDQTSVAKEFEFLGKYFRPLGQVNMLGIGKLLNSGQIGRRHRAPFQVCCTGYRQGFDAVIHAGIDPPALHARHAARLLGFRGELSRHTQCQSVPQQLPGPAAGPGG